jgi:Holliday junction resolvasome RuvABC ATP-dependent DNA helicase subunit
MKNKTKNIKDSYEDISLYNYLLENKAITILKKLVDQFHWDKIENKNPIYPSIILFGAPYSCKQLAKATSNCFGNKLVEICGNYTFHEDLREMAEVGETHTYFFSSIDKMTPHFEMHLYKVLTEGKFSILNAFEGKAETFYISKDKLLIFSAEKTYQQKMNPNLLQTIDVIIELEDSYNENLIYLSLIQKCKYCDWEYEDNALKLISLKCGNNIERAYRLLQMSYYFVRSKGENLINMEVVRKAIVLRS